MMIERTRSKPGAPTVSVRPIELRRVMPRSTFAHF
jgi:hypothetical protein